MTQQHTLKPSSASSLSRMAWTIVGMLWLVAMLNYLDRQLITTMGKPIKADLGIADGRFGLFSSVFLWVYGALSPVAGYVADRFGRHRVIVASLLVWSLVTWLTGHVRSFEQMLVARALMGISEAFYIPAAVALIVDYHRGSTRSRATGLHLSGAYAGAILGGLGGWIAEVWGWRTGFSVFGIVGVGYALLLTAFLRSPPTEESNVQDASPSPKDPATLRFGATLRSLLSTRSFLLLLLVNAMVGAAFWTIKNWLPIFFQTELNVPQARAGIYGTSFFNAAAFVGMLGAGMASDTWSRRNLRARMLVPAIGFCIAAPCFFTVGMFHAAAGIILTVIIVGMAQGALDANLMPALCTLADSRHRSTGYGLLNFISTTTGGIMTYIGGTLKDRSIPLSATFQGAAIFILCAGLLLVLVHPRRTQTV